MAKPNPNTPRNLAAARGAIRYIGGDCPHGHGGERYTKGGDCVQCVAVRRGMTMGTRNRSKANCDNANLAREAGQTTFIPATPCRYGHSLRFVESNNCVECDLAQRKKHRLTQKKNRVRKIYGLSYEAHAALFERQDGLCNICKAPFVDMFSAHVDHCHTTKKVRGLLCLSCNAGLGLFKDSANLMLAAISYLEQA